MKKLTIAIPAYNNEKTIKAAIASAKAQNYNKKRIIVFDDCSTDNTRKIARDMKVEVFKNKENLGIGLNLERIFNSVKSNYLLFLCADDVFADIHVAGDVVQIFSLQQKVGVIDRPYYQFMDGNPGVPVMTVRNRNIFISSCNPSGMAFRLLSHKIKGTNKIFIELPSIVKQYLYEGWEWTKIPYDTVAVRIHPGGNTGTKASYYTDSPVKVWSEFLDGEFRYNVGLVQVKNRCPKLLWREIINTVALDKRNLIDPTFWFFAIVAVITPSFILRWLSDIYRIYINSYFCNIIRRD